MFLSHLKHKSIHTPVFLAFTLVFLLLLIPLICIFTINHKSFLWGIDAIGQYYPAFLYIGQYLRRAIKTFSLPLFDLSIGFGEDIIGSLNYYGFGDPINLLSIFATANSGVYLYAFSYLLRLYLTGISFILYAKHFKYSDAAILAGSLLYTFNGFTLYGGIRYLEWSSVMIYLPLILLGVEQIWNKKSPLLFILSVCLGALCGFYFLYMVSLFLAVYCIVRLAYRSHSFFITISECISCLGYYLVGICLSAPILFPAISAYLHSARSVSVFSEAFSGWEMFLPVIKKDLFANLFVGGLSEISSLCILEIPLFFSLFLDLKSSRRKQIIIGIIGSTILLFTPIIGYLFNGFGEYNQRFVFLVFLIYAIGVTEAFSGIRKREYQLITIVLLCLNIVFNIYALYTPKYSNFISEFITTEEVKTFTSFPGDDSYTIYEDSGIYRVSFDSINPFTERPENIAMLHNTNSIQYWFSIVNENTQRFVNFVTDTYYDWRSFGLLNEPFFETIVGVKYHISRDLKNTPYTYYETETITFNQEEWHLYQNPDFFGLSYVRNIGPDNNSYDDVNDWYKLIYNELTRIDNYSVRSEEYNKKKSSYLCQAIAVENQELVISIPYSQNWRAMVNGHSVKPIQKNLMFITVPLEPGLNNVKLIYQPMAFYTGLGFSVFGIISLLYIMQKRKLK